MGNQRQNVEIMEIRGKMWKIGENQSSHRLGSILVEWAVGGREGGAEKYFQWAVLPFLWIIVSIFCFLVFSYFATRPVTSVWLMLLAKQQWKIPHCQLLGCSSAYKLCILAPPIGPKVCRNTLSVTEALQKKGVKCDKSPLAQWWWWWSSTSALLGWWALAGGCLLEKESLALLSEADSSRLCIRFKCIWQSILFFGCDSFSSKDPYHYSLNERHEQSAFWFCVVVQIYILTPRIRDSYSCVTEKPG